MARTIEVKNIITADYSKSEFQGVDVPDYLLPAFRIECEKDGKLNYSSNVYTREYSVIEVGDYWTDDMFALNDLGRTASLCIENGWQPTGNLIFSGYFEEYYDTDSRDECVREVVVGEERERVAKMQYWRISNGMTGEEKFVATDKGLLAVDAYAVAKLGWLYNLLVQEVTEDKQPKAGGAFIAHCVPEYYERMYDTKDFNVILKAETEYTIQRYRAENR